MKDILGKELKEGDSVIFTFYRSETLYKSKIHRITPKTLIIGNDFHCVIRKSNVAHRIIKI